MSGEEIANEFKELAKISPDTSVAPAHGVAAIALSLSMKYHDMGMIKDGVLYQQYKMEGKNIRTIGLDDVFETAIRIEKHLLTSSERIAKIVVDALEIAVEDDAWSVRKHIDPDDEQQFRDRTYVVKVPNGKWYGVVATGEQDALDEIKKSWQLNECQDLTPIDPDKLNSPDHN